jgi:hypothetical protein
LRDFATMATIGATNNRQRDAAAVLELMVQGKKIPSWNDLRRTLSKPGKIEFDRITETVGKSMQYDRLRGKGFSFPGDLRLAVPRFGKNTKYLAARALLVGELMNGLKKVGKEVQKDFRVFWERFCPEEYDLANLDFEKRNGDGLCDELHSVYNFSVKRNARCYGAAAKRAESCLNIWNIRNFCKDLGTINLFGWENGRPTSYARLLYCEEQKSGEPILAVDTIEIGHKRFVQHNDHLRAMGLALIQLGLDSNVHSIIGNEGRVCYGLRQGFGNQYVDREIIKIGKTSLAYWGYNFHRDGPLCGTYLGKSSVLMRNWRRHMPRQD